MKSKYTLEDIELTYEEAIRLCNTLYKEMIHSILRRKFHGDRPSVKVGPDCWRSARYISLHISSQNINWYCKRNLEDLYQFYDNESISQEIMNHLFHNFPSQYSMKINEIISIIKNTTIDKEKQIDMKVERPNFDESYLHVYYDIEQDYIEVKNKKSKREEREPFSLIMHFNEMGEVQFDRKENKNYKKLMKLLEQEKRFL